jgi:hypothetical protein
LKAAYCERCNNVFSGAPWADQRPAKDRKCQSCGAGVHWERGAESDAWAVNTPPGFEYVVFKTGMGRPKIVRLPRAQQPPNPLWIGMGPNPSVMGNLETLIRAGARHWAPVSRLVNHPAPLWITDVDGTPIFVPWLMQMVGNHGRRKVVGGWESNADGGVLAGGDFFVEKAGTTGGPRGRPRKGATSPEFVIVRLEELLPYPLVEIPRRKTKANGDQHRELVRAVNVAVNHYNLNPEAVALQASYSRAWVYDAASQVLDEIPLIVEGPNMQIATDTQIAQTVRTLEACQAVIGDCARLIASRFPDDERIEAAVEQLLRSATVEQGEN